MKGCFLLWSRDGSLARWHVRMCNLQVSGFYHLLLGSLAPATQGIRWGHFISQMPKLEFEKNIEGNFFPAFLWIWSFLKFHADSSSGKGTERGPCALPSARWTACFQSPGPCMYCPHCLGVLPPLHSPGWGVHPAHNFFRNQVCSSQATTFTIIGLFMFVI